MLGVLRRSWALMGPAFLVSVSVVLCRVCDLGVMVCEHLQWGAEGRSKYPKQSRKLPGAHALD